MLQFRLKPEDSRERSTDPQGTLTAALEVLRRLDGGLVQLRELLAECAALNDPATLRRRAQSRAVEASEDADAALVLVEQLARELRQIGALRVEYRAGGR